MAKYINQVRYYGDGNAKNSASNVTLTTLQSGSTFHNTLPIVQLGI
jgi:hypothetical protein